MNRIAPQKRRGRPRMHKTCTVAGCDRPHVAFGRCMIHYIRHRRTGDVQADIPVAPRQRNKGKTCSVEGCERSADSRGWCTLHYTRWRIHGDLLHKRQTPPILHGKQSGYNRGCRCEECMQANRENHYAWVAKVHSRPIPEHVHGSVNGYGNYGCRCRPCTDAHVAKCKVYRPIWLKRVQSKPPPEHVHGTYNGYNAYGCRCDACRGAAREYHQRRKVAAGIG